MKATKNMKAVVIDGITPASNVHLTDAPVPRVRPGRVLVRVKAFGLNHSEQILRLEEITEGYIQKPVIPGIECVGVLEDPSDTGWQKGQPVVALMGGMGRSFDGSYAEYALLPAHHVFPIETHLPWRELAAIPETYFTAWGSLFESLHLQAGDRLLVRGATCALGYAAVQLAKALGATVIATTHKREKLPLLEGADIALLDDGTLVGRAELADVHKALDLVGPRVLRDTLRAIAPEGFVCHTGVLGGQYVLDDFDPIKDIPNGVYLTGFYSNTPSPAVIQDIFAFLAQHDLHPRIGASYDFAHIQDACVALDEGMVNGKIVVTVSEGL